MSAFDAFPVGRRFDYGTYLFTAQAIIAFAKKFDPQPFHIDAQAARNSMFGALCASGWHTTAVWMKKNLEYRDKWFAELEAEGKPLPVFGPSPGLRDLNWYAPVFAGDTIHYFNTTTATRQRKSKPEWGIVEGQSEGINQHGKTVITFNSAVLLRL